MVAYVVQRLAGLAFVFILVSIVAFLLMHATPGGPFDEPNMPLPPAAKENILRKYGLDQPLHIQYIRYMTNALRGDFGYSFSSPTETVAQVIGRTWPISITLGGITVVVALGSGILLGILAAIRQNSILDYVVTFIATLGLTVPNFVIALWLILIFAVELGWLPLGGWGEDWRQIIMPMIALGLGPMGIATRYTRASLVDVFTADYIRTARAKGLAERMVVMRHAIKNALIPIITVLGPRIPDLITGTIFVETMFRVPGLGKFFVESVLDRDYPMIMALMLLIAVLWGFVYLITDLLYTIIDPRVKLT
ncbi:ABC transporter permease [Roseiflexus castenholzii]|jgi:ABC-type dipeptide/oligopeptide/nickel transport system permease component|uniref:Binding-protein-dependent transport systems inner membrane component n=1 Tax=Roseiflexus castenholzii (strain DSM 13941 / HLO8) TaxID=383372 RepID=A7NMU8_ROSCS|nr:ABC transporter permease [Roseiflexus castenholzii]ABU58872.1 binding-protein-dependent transport systems inner membrane component [Roseiflexus castenholzii DSM 13941]